MKKFVMRLSTVAVLILAVLSGVSLFWVSQQVQQLEREQRMIRQQVASEQEGIRVLVAEWDYLNRPERLERLVVRYLDDMQTVQPENLLTNVSDVPEKPLPLADEGEAILSASVSASGSKLAPVAAKKAEKKIVRDIPDARIAEDRVSSGKDFNAVLDEIEEGAQ